MVSKKDIKLISSLKHKKFRDLNSAFVVEGRKSISEFLISQFKLVKLFSIDCSAFDFVTNQIEVDYNELKKISFFNNPDDHLAIFEIPNKNPVDHNNLIIALESIRDPGNLGTIIRTLDWFGFKEVFCSKETVDFYNNKTVMASMGSIFRIQTHYIEFIELQKLFPNHELYRTSVKGKNIGDLEIKPKSIIVIGNESIGVSDNLKKIIPNTLTIPGNGQAESLNVSVASGIILNELVKKINLQT